MMIKPRALSALTLLAVIACDPKSASLGDESNDPTSGDPQPSVEATSEVLATVDDSGLFHIDVNDSGMIFVAGHRTLSDEGGDGPTFENQWLGVFSADGTPQWEYLYEVGDRDQDGASDEVVVTDVALAADGSAYATILDFHSLTEGSLILEFDASGTLIAEHSITARPTGVEALPDGGVVAIGKQPADDPNGQSFAWATARASTGESWVEQTWADGNEGRSLLSVLPLADGRLLFGGALGNDDVQSDQRTDGWLVWTDMQLNELDRMRVDPLENGRGVVELHELSDGSVVFVHDAFLEPELVTLDTAGSLSRRALLGVNARQTLPLGPAAYMGFETTEQCPDENWLCGLGAHLAAFDEDIQRWRAPGPNCNAGDLATIDLDHAIVTRICDGVAAPGHTEIVRITSPQ